MNRKLYNGSDCSPHLYKTKVQTFSFKTHSINQIIMNTPPKEGLFMLIDAQRVFVESYVDITKNLQTTLQQRLNAKIKTKFSKVILFIPSFPSALGSKQLSSVKRKVISYHKKQRTKIPFDITITKTSLSNKERFYHSILNFITGNLRYQEGFNPSKTNNLTLDLQKFAYSPRIIADILSTSQKVIHKKIQTGVLFKNRHGKIPLHQLIDKSDIIRESLSYRPSSVLPSHSYSVAEFFAGGGGMALGLEKAGFTSLLVNEKDKDACATLRKNRPKWNVLEEDISKVNTSQYIDKNTELDLVAGGFPCQPFSYAGKLLGFKDVRGTLFYEFARVIKELSPKLFVAENVKGILKHDNGQTLSTICSIFGELGYTIICKDVFKAIFYKVPQKRERVFIIGVRNDVYKLTQGTYTKPKPCPKIYTVQDAFRTSDLFENSVPPSKGQKYPQRKKEIMKHVPPGGFWKDLPIHLQEEYMQKSLYLGGGKTGMARRLSLQSPSLTLTCAPAQKQTERCHPLKTRPLRIREYARIQTFPDNWLFHGSVTSQYKQIGNAVPVNLAHAIGQSLLPILNTFYEKTLENHDDIEY